MTDILNKNLDNVQSDTDLFGVKIEKLSMRDRIGFLPISIWEPNWNIVKELKPIVGDDGSSRELVGGKMALPGSKYTTSIFNPHLAQMILSAYCPTKAKIYDPFAGGGTRGFIATAMGHTYSGIEIRKEEVDRIKEQQTILSKSFEIKIGDSQNRYYDNNSFDFCYTCPPYYNLEVYSKLEDDLSNAPTYNDFLCMMLKVMRTTYELMRVDTLTIFVVGNFRNKEGELLHFNGDIVSIAKNVGYKLHDELIFWGASKCASQRCGQFEANRKSVRVHEYIIVLRK